MARFGNLAMIEKLAASVSRPAQIFKSGLIVFATGLILLALARPQFGTKLRTMKREGQDMIIALDVSASMLAEDIKPNRLEKAKHEISSIIDRLEGDRIGLIAFSGKAFVQCPLTLDYAAAKMFLEYMEPDLIPVPGTKIDEAIQKAVDSFVEKERKHKVLILITDGEEHDGKAEETAKAAASQGIVIYTVGIGSFQGVPIPVYDSRGNRTADVKRDRRGEVVMTKLDEVTLEKIALETGGKYYRATPGEAELDQIYESVSQMEKKTLASQQFAQYEDRFQFFVGFAFIILILEIAIPERKRIRREWKGRFE
ncbi:VWA domain-containing protein [bacterium]|nr:VWA domain-containing protein [bacterium]